MSVKVADYTKLEWVEKDNLPDTLKDGMAYISEDLMFIFCNGQWELSLAGSTICSNTSKCYHEWIETKGFNNTYKDCKKCGMKWEDYET